MWNCPDVTTLAEHSLLFSFPTKLDLKDFSSCVSFPAFTFLQMVANKSGLVIDIGAAKSPESPIYIFARARSLTLQALERDLGGLNKTSWDEGAVYGAVRYRGAASSNNTASWEGEEDEETSLNSLTMPDLVDSREPGGPSLAALRHLKSDDIDMFIANMAVPPPPSVVRQQQVSQHNFINMTIFDSTMTSTSQVQQKHSPVVELTSEELSAFIIPPPPATAGHRGGGDREVLELRVAAHQKAAPATSDNNALSPKIASLQERLAQLSSRCLSTH